MLAHTGLHTHTYPLSEQMTPGCYFLLCTEDPENAFEPHIQGASPPTSVCASSHPALLLQYRHSMWSKLRRLPSPISMCVSLPPQESLLTMTLLCVHPLYPHWFCPSDCSLTKHDTSKLLPFITHPSPCIILLSSPYLTIFSAASPEPSWLHFSPQTWI